MTGAYLRVQRDGTWMNVEIDLMTDSELEALAERQPDRGWTWAIFLARWIRDNVQVQEERSEEFP